MKILFLTKRYHPYIGGVEKHVQEISKELIKLGHSITIITELPQKTSGKNKKNYHLNVRYANQAGESKEHVESSHFELEGFDNLQIIRFDPGRQDFFKKIRIWVWFVKNRKLIYDADLIHCHDVFFWYLPLRFIFPSKKVFTTFHGYESHPVAKKAIVIRKISELLSSGNICVGDFIKKWYGTKPDYVIYGGVSKFDRPKKINIPNALFFGRLDEQTGIRTYILGAEKLRKEIKGFRLDVVGEGSFRKIVKGEIKKFSPDIEEVIKNYRYIFVSGYLSILEALAAQKMVFAVYDNPLKEDYLKMAPFADFISISKDEASLVKSVQYYYSNSKFERKRVKKGYNWAKKQTWRNIVQVYLKLWQK